MRPWSSNMRASWLFLAHWTLFAQTVHSACSVAGTTTIQNVGDTTALASCQTFSGSIAIATGFSSDATIDGVKRLTGDLIVDGSSELTGLSSDSLQKIDGEFMLSDAVILNSVQLPELTSVDAIVWRGLPNLQEVDFKQGISSSKVDIQNTQISSLNITAADEISIANNPSAKDVSIGLNNVTKSLMVQFNNPEMKLDLPNLYWANNMTFRNVSNLNMPLINTVNDTLMIYGTTMEKLELSNLNVLKGNLLVVSNGNLTDISMPGLLQLGDLMISNNSALDAVSLDQLGVINGNVEIIGNINEVSLPVLSSVSGDFVITPVDTSQMDCSQFDKYKSDGTIKKDYKCEGKHSGTDPSTSGSASSSSTAQGGARNESVESSSSRLSTGAKAGIGIGVSLGAISLIAAGILIFFGKKKQKHEKVVKSGFYEKPELDGEGVKIAEVDSMHANYRDPPEMGHGKEAQELPAEHGASEAIEAHRRVYEMEGGTARIGS